MIRSKTTRPLAAAIVSAAFVFVSLSAIFLASILQADVCRECGARLDVVLFGATIAGPTLPLWPILAAGLLYAITFPKSWAQLAWAALPVGLMLLGDGLHHLLSIWGGGLVTIPHGLALTWVGGDGAHLSCGGNLPATAGLVGGVVWLAKRTVFDALVTRPSEPTVDPAE